MHTKLKTIIVLGFLTIIIPFFGIPIAWKEWIVAIMGVAVVVLAVQIRRKFPKKPSTSDRVYVENSEEHTEPLSEL